MSDELDLGRRHFLTVATTVTGVAGAALVAVPFVASLRPSARAQALGAPVEIDISKLEPGALVKVEWRGRPVWVLNRTPLMLQQLREVPDGELRDPASQTPQQPPYAANPHRSIRPQYLVVLGSCTHLGCSPIARFEPGGELGPEWQGGFYCPCHGSKFDLAGRVYDGVPAPLNLLVPPHRYLGESVILIGADTGAA